MRREDKEQDSMALLTTTWIAVTLALAAEGNLVATVPDGFELVEGSLRFSQDGTHVAYVATKNGKFHPVVGGEVGAAYDEVAPPVAVVGERSSEPCAEIACIVWDPSGKRVRYGCREGRQLLWRELALE